MPLLQQPLRLAIIVILLLVGGLYWYAGQQQQRYDAAATQYLRAALTDIGSWQRAALRRQLAPEALRAVSDAQLDALDDRYRPLGAFRGLEQVQFGRLAAALSWFGNTTLLNYHAVARFEHGSAELTATLIVRDGGFRLYNFSLASPQLHRGN